MIEESRFVIDLVLGFQIAATSRVNQPSVKIGGRKRGRQLSS